jgi:hypothetical protein
MRRSALRGGTQPRLKRLGSSETSRRESCRTRVAAVLARRNCDTPPPFTTAIDEAGNSRRSSVCSSRHRRQQSPDAHLAPIRAAQRTEGTHETNSARHFWFVAHAGAYLRLPLRALAIGEQHYGRRPSRRPTRPVVRGCGSERSPRTVPYATLAEFGVSGLSCGGCFVRGAAQFQPHANTARDRCYCFGAPGA